jgi:glutamate mutase epsilon subunit
MPTLTGDVVANYNQVGNVNGLGGFVRIYTASKTNMTTAQVNTLVKGMMAGFVKATDDAVSIAGLGTADGTAFVSGTTDVITIAVQGTGEITTGADWNSTGFTLALVAVFKDKDADQPV